MQRWWSKEFADSEECGSRFFGLARLSGNMSTDAPRLHGPAELPNDPAFLKWLIAHLIELLRQRDQRLTKLEHHLDLLQTRCDQLSHLRSLQFSVARRVQPPSAGWAPKRHPWPKYSRMKSIRSPSWRMSWTSASSFS